MTHSVSGVFYIGSTANMRRRGNEHLADLARRDHDNKRLQQAFNDSPLFTWEFIQMDDKEASKNHELYLIHKHAGNPLLANVIGLSPSEETSEKRQLYWTPERRAEKAIQIAGLIRTDETREKIAATKRGVKRPVEMMEKLNGAKRKSVTLDGTTYISVMHAGAALGLDPKTVTNRIKSLDVKWIGWMFET